MESPTVTPPGPAAAPQAAMSDESPRVTPVVPSRGTAILVLAHGAAASLDQLEAYYAHILHGRRPTPERLAALRDRYVAIGGASPLNRLTRWQASQIAAHLHRLRRPAPVYIGFLHTPPSIATAVRTLIADGARRVVVLVLSPYDSPLALGPYVQAVEQACQDAGTSLHVDVVRSWSWAAGFRALLARRLQAALATFRPTAPTPLHVVFTAHSLPARAANPADPYIAQYQAVARSIAKRLGLTAWSTCYQSASETGEPWLEPDILDELAAVAKRGARSVVVCPTSFTADNLEVLYDLGIAAAERAQELGLVYTYVSPFNDDPAFPGFLAMLLAARLRSAEPV